MLKSVSAHGTQKSKFRAVGCLYRHRRSFFVAIPLQFYYFSKKVRKMRLIYREPGASNCMAVTPLPQIVEDLF